MNFNMDFKTIKELIVKYGFFKVVLTLTLCAAFLIVCWKMPEIIAVLK